MNISKMVWWFGGEQIQTPPVISVLGGGSAYTNSVLTVTSFRIGVLTYQWYKDGTPISGEIYNNFVVRPGDEFSEIYVIEYLNGGSPLQSNTLTVEDFSAIWIDNVIQHDFILEKENVRIFPDVDDDYLNGLLCVNTTEEAGLNGKKSLRFSGNVNSLAAIRTFDITGDSSFFSMANDSNDLPATISFWFKPNGTLQSSRRIIHKGIVNSGTLEWRVFLQSTGQLQLMLTSGNEGGNFRARATNTGAIISGNWYHIVITYNGQGGTNAADGIKIYINNVRADTTTFTAGSYTKMIPVSNNGGLYFANATTGGLDMNIAEFSFWRRELDEAQINLLYNSGTPLIKRENTNPEYYAIRYYVISRSGNYWFATDGNNLLFSDDAGETYYTKVWGTQYSSGLPIHDKAIAFGHVFDDGTVLFATAAQLYRSTDGLVNISTVAAQNMDGSAFVFHTPSNASRPGAYFWHMNFDNRKEYINGEEIVVWGNYCNNGPFLALGASPTVLWYTIDKGATVKAMYVFGQNPAYRDDGSAGGGTTGTLLGDSSNTLITRHIHCHTRRTGTNEWWSATGDIGTTREEIHILKHTYDPVNDEWTHDIILQNQDDNTRYKLGDFGFINSDEFIFTADATTAAGNVPVEERGVHRTTVANFGTSSTQLYDETNGAGVISAETICSGFNREGGKLITTAWNSLYTNSVWVSRDFGNLNLQRRVLPNANVDFRPGKISPLVDDYWSFPIGWVTGPIQYTYFIRGF